MTVQAGKLERSITLAARTKRSAGTRSDASAKIREGDGRLINFVKQQLCEMIPLDVRSVRGSTMHCTVVLCSGGSKQSPIKTTNK